MKWINANTIVGPAAAGANYFPRPGLQRKLWREIEKGNHVLFTAPRRIGKSSVMKYLAKYHGTDYICDYKNISSDATTKELYKRLFNLALMAIESKSQTKKRLQSWFKTIGIQKIGTDGVTFTKESIDYKNSLIQLLPELEKAELKVVLFVDEFPDVIRNIHKNESTAAALDVLQTLRSLRHEDDFKGCLTLVLAGSIGLDHVVKEIDRTIVINDLNFQYLPVLTRPQATDFINHLVKDASMQISPEVRNYLLNKLVHAMPYYIQLLIDNCDDLLFEESRKTLMEQDIDQAWKLILDESKYFSDWDERLEDYFPKDYPFFVEILKVCAHQNRISIQEVFDLAGKYQLEISYKAKMDDVLVKDGYLYQDGTHFSFLSPLLQEWWKNRHPLL